MTLTVFGMAIMNVIVTRNTRYVTPTVVGMATVPGSTSFSRCGFHTPYRDCTTILSEQKNKVKEALLLVILTELHFASTVHQNAHTHTHTH